VKVATRVHSDFHVRYAFQERVISFGKPQIDKAIFAEAQTRMMSD
jgi:hypothetical protein